MKSFTESELASRGARGRISRRYRARGAAFIESLIVISMILSCLFAVLWFHALYSSKLQTIESARASAWNSALSGCAGLEKSQELLSRSARDAEVSRAKGGNHSTEGDAAGISADTQGESSPDWFELREGGESQQFVDFSHFGQEGTMPVGTRRKFQCNERPNPKELTLSGADLLSNLASVIRDLFN
jgi:hypothetical protein